MAWTNPKTWVANDVLTAAELNTHVRDNLLALGTWTTYTPSWTATGGTPTLGNGTLNGEYIQVGALLLWRVTLVWGSTTSAGTTTLWNFTIPGGFSVSGFSENQVPTTGWDASTGVVVAGYSYASSVTTFQPIFPGTNQRAGYNVPWTWATSDRLQIQGMVHIA